MKITLMFDVYGTPVDPSGMAKHLADDLGTLFHSKNPVATIWDVNPARETENKLV